MIELVNIHKSYHLGKEEVPILKDINLKIYDGEFVAIMGPSGSGKSTLMNIIGCLDRASSGSYLLNEQEISTYSDEQLAKVRNIHIGFVFQQFQLLPRLSAVENVELPMVYAGVSRKERRARAEAALAKVGLSERMKHLPSELSGGQKQRVAIARSIVNNPTLILADEPTGALDTKTSADIMEQFSKLNADGTTVVVITHEPEVAEYTSRTVIVRDGKVLSHSDKENDSL
ncbi:ABC transporter ATP-binding protein [Priestia aryabhattai]|uniref:ABC transporter ATP-binding protein n=1 Tax=Priestia TaxID=2800373 RepID=UPI00048E7E4A|nr:MULTISPECIES: ABC transporter ATP-binding protein [Priestia]MCL9633283.1 ABC transporter ATP-binding protein [Bacillus zanthoxyli]NHH93675.1 putative ABC transporter ATP-binding protein YknY [Bacillus sp. MB95]KML28053.1 macrolide ABC transporter ATP-binding protein [Priestia aryabhattai]KMN93677.1 macrolide ABC transporter ATP-binding protein [Priestia aryabhattai]MBY0076190.1 ABC transporter ATP-binding protein [Priestia aryabhattai]